jgi:hypothetical protein
VKSAPLVRLVVSTVIGLAVGLIVAGLVNLFLPSANLAWTIVPLCCAAAISGFVGCLVGARQKKEPARKEPPRKEPA